MLCPTTEFARLELAESLSHDLQSMIRSVIDRLVTAVELQELKSFLRHRERRILMIWVEGNEFHLEIVRH